MVPESDLVLRIPATSDVAKTSIATPQRRGHRDRPAVRHDDRVRRQAGEPVGAGLPARPVREHPGAGHRPDPLVLVQLRARPRRGRRSWSATPARRAHHLPARPGPGRRQDRVQRPAGQLLPARDQAPGAVPRRRHRAGAVPVHAGQDRGGGRLGAPDPPDLRRHQRRRPGRARRAGGLRRRAWTNFTFATRGRGRGVAATRTRATSPTTSQPEHLNDGEWTSTSAARRRWSTRSASTWPTRACSRPASTTRSSPAAAWSPRSARSTSGCPSRTRPSTPGWRWSSARRTWCAGRLSADQLAEYRRLAEATGKHISGGQFTDAAGFREANAAFHLFPVAATGNETLIQAHKRLLVGEYMGAGAVARRWPWPATSPRTT